jgi:hypothetical protein
LCEDNKAGRIFTLYSYAAQNRTKYLSEDRGGMMADIQDLNPASKVVTRRRMVMGAAVAFGGIAMGSRSAWAAAEDGVSHTAESIHQEPVFRASPKRVYEALIDTIR